MSGPVTTRTSPAGGADQDELRYLARDSRWGLVGGGAQGLLAVVLTLAVTWGLGPRNTGIFFTTVGLFTILVNVALLGAHTGLVRMIPRYRTLGRNRDLARLLRVGVVPSAVLSLVLALGLMWLAPALVRVLVDPSEAAATSGYLRAMSLFLPFAVVTTALLAATRGHGAIRPFVLVDNLGIPGLRPVLVLAGIWVGLGGQAVAALWGAAYVPAFVLAALALLRLQRRHGDGPQDPAPGRQVAAEFWRFTAPRGLSNAFQIAVNWSDVILVAALRSPREAGIYAAVSRTVRMGVFAINAIRIGIAPRFSRLLTEGRTDAAQDLYQTATWWLMAMTWPAYILAATFPSTVLRIFGPGFSEGATALTVLSVAMLIHLGTGNITTALLMAGRSSWNLANTTTSVTVNVVLNVLLIPPFGMTGAALAWAGSIILENVLALLEVRFLVGIRPFGPSYLTTALAPLACFGLAGLALRSALGPSATTLALAALAGAVPYAITLWYRRGPLRLPLFLTTVRRRSRPALNAGGATR